MKIFKPASNDELKKQLKEEENKNKIQETELEFHLIRLQFIRNKVLCQPAVS